MAQEPWGPTGERNKSRGDAADPEEAESPLPAPLPGGPWRSAGSLAAAAQAGTQEGALGLEPRSRSGRQRARPTAAKREDMLEAHSLDLSLFWKRKEMLKEKSTKQGKKKKNLKSNL